MSIEFDERTEIIKMQVWMAAWEAAVRSENASITEYAPGKYANRCLEEFENKFLNKVA